MASACGIMKAYGKGSIHHSKTGGGTMSEEKKQPAVELTDAELDKVAGGSGGKALV